LQETGTFLISLQIRNYLLCPGAAHRLYSLWMSRTARAIIGSHCYHVINRANNGARIFHEYGDYAAFVALMAEAQERCEMPLLAACVMPNHLHLVVRPKEASDLARWTHWLFTTHVRRYHAKYQTTGRIWQGRYKAFVAQEDHHLLAVLRYVERNALRANLVCRAEDWRWGSLAWRQSDNHPLRLAPIPVSLPMHWSEYVNQAQTAAELESVRTCVNRQRPFGDQQWVGRTAMALGMMQSLAPRGRPKRR
jgi:putative transposase